MPERICIICKEQFYTKSSRRKICYKDHYHPCPICGKEVKTDSYHKNNCCCLAHSRQLAAKHTFENCGEWPVNSEAAKQKRKQTCIERYGVENPYQSNEIKEKIRQTLLNRYGVDNPSKSDEIKERRKSTNIARYGGTSPMHSGTVKEKLHNTIKEKYGIDAYSTWSVPAVREKQRQTCIEKYGVGHYMQNPVLNQRHQIKRKMLGIYSIKPKICKLCGESFKPWTIRQTYCNREHFAECKICGKKFIINNNYTIPNTCSKECRQILAVQTTNS